MEISGNITWIGAEVKGTSQSGKEWRKKPFEVEYQSGQFPKRIVFDCFDTNIIDKLAVGLQVNVKFDITTHDYNGRKFNNFQIWKDGLHATGGTAQPTAQPAPQPAQAPAPPAVGSTPAPPATDGNLPF